ncbi:hypothetical protein LTR86_002720 [Recurvomyces mirabilis]|nr:hypothetical protein LTR86_002720 [Recurvomyces mirabilis]
MSKAPPAKKATSRISAGFNKLAQDIDALAKIRENAAESVWFDKGAPGTRKRREAARANFELTKSHRKVFIGGETDSSTSPQSSLVSHIHLLGLKHGLEGSHRVKNNLGRAEIKMFFRQLLEQSQQVENWQQNFVVWVLIYMTSVRPGSVTVSPGYEQGASLGASGLTRPTDETLRWSDLTFMRHDDFAGIAITVTFKYIKNQRNPYNKKIVQAAKKFTFLPAKGSDYEFDLSALFVGLAFSRGLFDKKYRTVQDLHHGNEMFLQLNPPIAKQAVFVQAEPQSGALAVEHAMKERPLNEKLQQMCRMTGLLNSFTMYSLRRTAIIETRRTEGTEMAKELAGHNPYSTAIISYDNVGLGDVDITALRLGDKESMVSRQKLRDMFSQSRIAKFQPEAAASSSSTDAGATLSTVINERTKAAMQADQEYIDIETELSDACNAISIQLGMEEPLSTSGTIFETYRRLLREKDLDDSVKTLDDILTQRKLIRKKLTNRYQHSELEKMREEQKKLLTTTRRKAENPFGGRGAMPEPLRQAIQDSSAAAAVGGDDGLQAALDSIEIPGEDEVSEDRGDEEPAMDEDVVDEALDKTHEEPKEWQHLEDEVIVRPESDQDEPVDEATMFQSRIAFISSFASLTSTPVSSLKCILCALDPSTPQRAKDERTHVASSIVTSSHPTIPARRRSSVQLRTATSPMHLKDEHEDWI